MIFPNNIMLKAIFFRLLPLFYIILWV
jgi:hypothetical protein